MERRDLTKGSILGNILTFALPYMLSYFLQILYGLADLFVTGRYCDVASITSVSNGAQVMYMFTVIIIGLAMGATVRVATAMGSGDKRAISRIIGNAVTMFLILAFVLSGVLICLRNGIVSLIKTPADAVQGAREYLTICFAGIPFIVAYNVIAAIFRGLGDTRSPLRFVAIACVINIALDFLFIAHFGLGPRGAALATVISQMVSVLTALFAISRHRSVFSISREDLRPRRDTMSGILKIGVPVALQDGFIQVAFIVITVIANRRGLDDAAAVGIVEKVIGLLFVVSSSMLSTVSAIAAQNIGAARMDRAKATMRVAMMISVGFGTIWAVLFQFIPESAVGVFTSDPEVIRLGGQYLKGYVWDCVLAGIHFCFSGFFTACGWSFISFCHNFLSIVCVRIPLSWVASNMFPESLYPMGLASPAGSLLSVLICITVYTWMSRHGKFVQFQTSESPRS